MASRTGLGISLSPKSSSTGAFGGSTDSAAGRMAATIMVEPAETSAHLTILDRNNCPSSVRAQLSHSPWPGFSRHPRLEHRTKTWMPGPKSPKSGHDGGESNESVPIRNPINRSVDGIMRRAALLFQLGERAIVVRQIKVLL